MLMKGSADLAELCANTGAKHILQTFLSFFLADIFYFDVNKTTTKQEFLTLYKLKN